MSPTEPIATQWTRLTTSDHRDRPVVAASGLPVDRVRAVSLSGSPSPVDPSRRDIMFDVMWSVEVESEVEKWIDSLPVKEFATVLAAVARQAMRRCIAEGHTAEEDD